MSLIESVVGPTWDPERVDRDVQALKRLARGATDFYYKYPSQTKDGRFIPVAWSGERAPDQPGLSTQDIKEVAAEYGLPVAHLKAVIDVESAGSGFLRTAPGNQETLCYDP